MDVVELCAGAGGQALGLERAGFEHALAVELDGHACQTLQHNRPSWKIAQGDVADVEVWDPRDYSGVTLLAGGVPCPPFSVAGKQLGATDERDLFAWAVETCAIVRPRVLLLENVRGLSEPRFGGYRQHVLHRLSELGYVGEWRLLHASDYGVPQLRPRFVLVAMAPEDMAYFHWPEPVGLAATVGETLVDLMAANGWRHAESWSRLANAVAPTIVGGSKRHGGADLGPTRAKRAWQALGVDGMGIADKAPPPGWPAPEISDRRSLPRLTTRMVQRLQGWDESWGWEIQGRKTATYRQIGNAFPPPVAEAVGRTIKSALARSTEQRDVTDIERAVHDDVYLALASADAPLTASALSARLPKRITVAELERRLRYLAKDFAVVETSTDAGTTYFVEGFKAFTGQEMHARHEYMAARRSLIS